MGDVFGGAAVQRFFAAKVVVNGYQIDASAIDELASAGPFKPARAERVDGGLEHSTPRDLASILFGLTDHREPAQSWLKSPVSLRQAGRQADLTRMTYNAHYDTRTWNG